MSDTTGDSGTEEALRLTDAYLRERVRPHPILNRFLTTVSIYVPGPAVMALGEENAPFSLRLLAPNQPHAELANALKSAGLWRPARDFRLRLEDREPFRRCPSAELLFLSHAQLKQEFRFDLPPAFWTHQNAAIYQDPDQQLALVVQAADARFAEQLEWQRCERYYRFRQARSDLSPRITPARLATVRAIKRGDAAREALRLAFLAEGKPYPPDRWLEERAERETACGAGIVDAVRALIAAVEPELVAHTSKVLRDRVVFALQQGGVRARWLEQWWLWPSIAPGQEECVPTLPDMESGQRQSVVSGSRSGEFSASEEELEDP
jgi:hypothetical protein